MYWAITQQIHVCHRLFWGQLIAEQPWKSHCTAHLMHSCITSWKMCCGSSLWVQKVSKKDYEISLTIRAVPGLSDLQGPTTTLLYSLIVAKQWQTWPLFLHMAMIPRVMKSPQAAVCFDNVTSKLISHYLRICRFYLEFQCFSELPKSEKWPALKTWVQGSGAVGQGIQTRPRHSLGWATNSLHVLDRSLPFSICTACLAQAQTSTQVQAYLVFLCMKAHDEQWVWTSL